MEESEQTPGLGRRVRHVLVTWGLPLLALISFRSAVASPFHVPTGSMVPSIEVGDRILVSKLAYGLNVPWLRLDGTPGLGTFTTREVLTWDEPERGDVVLFRFPPDPSIDYVKRVVGVPGDLVEVRDHQVLVNGELQAQELIGDDVFVDARCEGHPTHRFVEDLGGVAHPVLRRSRTWSPGANFGPVTVPEGTLFVLGDNREHSADSRFWGLVPRENVRGRAVGVWMSAGCDRGVALEWEDL